jgi:uncharacterized membrane protein YdcZ (DUF606 family)
MCEFHPWRKYMNTKRFGFAGVLAAFALAVSTLVAPSASATTEIVVCGQMNLAGQTLQK